MKKIIIILSLLSATTLSSQEIVLERNVADDRDSVEDDNSKSQLKWGYNLTLDVPDSLNTLWSSTSINYTGMKLFRPAKFYSLGLNYGIQFDNFKLEQDSANLLSVNQKNYRQQLHLYTGRIGLINRFHLGKHGVKEGAFIEVGAVGAIRITSRMKIENEIDPKAQGNAGAQEVNITYKRLQYIELLQYYATAAIGRNGLALYGEYRISNLFKKYEAIHNDIKLPEIAPLNIGLRVEF
ncbi:MAG: hypothetical protein ACI8QW_000207 [Saprospiraceae bacterium]|jgi:hypothetical protein